jgi:hypothetical protein
VNITQGKIIADVLDDPSQMFLIQNDGTSTAADYGKNADIVVGTGSTTTGVSANELDTSSNCYYCSTEPKDHWSLGRA